MQSCDRAVTGLLSCDVGVDNYTRDISCWARLLRMASLDMTGRPTCSPLVVSLFSGNKICTWMPGKRSPADCLHISSSLVPVKDLQVQKI
jgi:hypothetical protein